MKDRYREQARSHMGSANTDPLWERACSGRRSDDEALTGARLFCWLDGDRCLARFHLLQQRRALIRLAAARRHQRQ